jgi:hypothetical protein
MDGYIGFGASQDLRGAGIKHQRPPMTHADFIINGTYCFMLQWVEENWQQIFDDMGSMWDKARLHGLTEALAGVYNLKNNSIVGYPRTLVFGLQ